MTIVRMVTAATLIALLGGCSSSPEAPPRLPLSYVDRLHRESTIQLDEGGVGTVAHLLLALSTGPDCIDGRTDSYSGQVEWRLISDYQAQMTADGTVVYLRIKGSFGVPDWSTIYLNSCTGDTDLGGWTTFVGGTGP